MSVKDWRWRTVLHQLGHSIYLLHVPVRLEMKDYPSPIAHAVFINLLHMLVKA